MPDDSSAPVLFIPHGGGPLPLLDDPGHRDLTAFLSRCSDLLPRPDAILVISAHWESGHPTLLGAAAPPLLYDYSGFPPESYRLQYPAPGAPELAQQLAARLRERGFNATVDEQRGFDHGLFVPLSLIYPRADIPCLQLSLLASMSAGEHLALGRALSDLREHRVLIIGSGSSFHNMEAFRDGESARSACEAFDDWLTETCCHCEPAAAASRLQHWDSAPGARYAHPREEHLLPLHVCFGAAMAAGGHASRIFNGEVMGFRMSAFLWD
jgi:aromatic ring-opening dioxygenase catalytic subunit (LigB family)